MCLSVYVVQINEVKKIFILVIFPPLPLQPLLPIPLQFDHLAPPGPTWSHLVLHLLCVLYLYLSFLHPSFYLFPPLFNSLIKLKAKIPSLVFFFSCHCYCLVHAHTHLHTPNFQIFVFFVFSLYFFLVC